MKSSKSVNLIITIFLTLTCLGVHPAMPVQAQAPSNIDPSAEKIINPDGTLKLDGVFNGSIDLDGWNVQIDSRRGPVFSSNKATPPGEWDSLSGGVGSINGAVYAILIIGSNVYVGGSFRNVGNNPDIDYIAKWDGVNWSPLGTTNFGSAALNGTVRALATDGLGNIYAGGSFTYVNNEMFQLPEAKYIARWDGNDWYALGSNGVFGGSLNGTVDTIAVSGSNVYVGGRFTNVNNNGSVLFAADYVAKWDGTNWSALGSNGAGNGSINNWVFALAISGSNVYAGGNFSDVNNNGTVLGAADRIARWDGTNWTALGSDGAGNGSITSGNVESIAVSGPDVYVGGLFFDLNNNGTILEAADNIAKWDGTDWSALGSNGNGDGSINSNVYNLAIDGTGNVYAGGWFTDVNDNGVSLTDGDYLAKWDGTDWSAVGSNGAGEGSLNRLVEAIAIDGNGNLYTGGLFTDVNNGGAALPHADYFASWDGTDWTAPGGIIQDGSLNRDVYAITVVGTDVYVGGNFTDVENTSGMNIPEADYIVKWDGANWSALGSNGSGNGSLSGYVSSIAVDSNGNILAGGGFTNVNNNGVVIGAADYIAKWDGTNWSALGSDGAGNGSIKPHPSFQIGYVNSVAISGANVYVGGWFIDVNNSGTTLSAADYIAKWDGTNWSALGSNGTGNGSLNSEVLTIVVSGSDVYVGGFFTDVNNNGAMLQAADYIAKWNGTNWSALGSNGSGNGSLNSDVYAVAIRGTDVYAGGHFTNVNNNGTILQAADYIAKWNGTNWSALGSNGFGDGSLNSDVLALLVDSSGNVFAGGLFANVNDNGTLLGMGDFVAKWDGANWSALGSNGSSDGSLNSYVDALGVIGSDLIVGGGFINVNNNGIAIDEADFIATYGIPNTAPPTVLSITRASTSPTAASSVDFTVTFSEDVQNVDSTDFILDPASAPSGSSVTSVTPVSASVYTVTVNTGTSHGSLRLDVLVTADIEDLAGNPLAGLPFTSGEVYVKIASAALKSLGANDGWILESTETSTAGGTMNSTATTLWLGDDASDRQYRAILHFDTSSLPDNAVITSATLQLRKQSTSGTNPFTILGSLRVDARRPDFGLPTLELTDFRASAAKNNISTFNPTPVGPWYSAVFNSTGRLYINRTGTTQFKIYFTTGDNDDLGADLIKFYSGNAGASSRPKLVIQYYVP